MSKRLYGIEQFRPDWSDMLTKAAQYWRLESRRGCFRGRVDLCDACGMLVGPSGRFASIAADAVCAGATAAAFVPSTSASMTHGLAVDARVSVGTRRDFREPGRIS